MGDGYCLSLDDFGAQYSNLSILSSLQLSELKIDKGIINDLYSNQNTRILVEHLIHICRQLGIDSVAEGGGGAGTAPNPGGHWLYLCPGLPLQQAHTRPGLRAEVPGGPGNDP